MNCVWTTIFLGVHLILFCSVHSLSLQSMSSKKTIPFTVDMLPIMHSLTSINSSSIQLIWHPSPSIEGINLTQLSGVFTVSLYVGIRGFTNTLITVFPMTELNETDEHIAAKLKQDTVCHVCFQTKWHEENSPIDGFALDGIWRRECRLLRTYMENQTTLNPVPPFGEYTWNETKTNSGRSAIIVNASISSELPYEKRNITVTLGTNIQSKAFNAPLEFVEFEFDQPASESKDYPLSITFMLLDYTIDHQFTATNTINGTVKTTVTNEGNKQFFCYSPFLIVLTMFLLFRND